MTNERTSGSLSDSSLADRLKRAICEAESLRKQIDSGKIKIDGTLPGKVASALELFRNIRNNKESLADLTCTLKTRLRGESSNSKDFNYLRDKLSNCEEVLLDCESKADRLQETKNLYHLAYLRYELLNASKSKVEEIREYWERRQSLAVKAGDYNQIKLAREALALCASGDNC